MNKPNIVIICVATIEAAQNLAKQLNSGELSVENLVKMPSDFKSAEQLTTEIVDAALSQFMTKLNNAEKPTKNSSLFTCCNHYLQQDPQFVKQLKLLFAHYDLPDLEDILEEYDLSFLPMLLKQY